MRELERREDQLRTDPRFLSRRAPPQTSGNHQVDDEKQIGAEFQHDALADTPNAGHRLAVDRFERWIDGAEDEGAKELQALETMANDEPLERLEIDNDVREFGQSIFFQPVDDLLAGPVMVVVQVQDDRVERQPLVAAFWASAADVLETVEEAIHPRPDAVRLVRVARQRIGPFVCRTERARSSIVGEIFAERLAWPALRAFGDRVGEFELIFARYLMHLQPLAVKFQL